MLSNMAFTSTSFLPTNASLSGFPLSFKPFTHTHVSTKANKNFITMTTLPSSTPSNTTFISFTLTSISSSPPNLLSTTTTTTTSTSSTSTRRSFLKLFFALALSVPSLTLSSAPSSSNNLAYAAPAPSAASLTSALVPIVRTRDALDDIENSINDGSYNSYDDVVRIVKIVMKGNQLTDSVKVVANNLPGKNSKEKRDAYEHGRDAIEYFSQITAYFDPVDLKSKPSSKFLKFALDAVIASKKEFDLFLKYVPPDQVQLAKDALNMDVSSL